MEIIPDWGLLVRMFSSQLIIPPLQGKLCPMPKETAVKLLMPHAKTASQPLITWLLVIGGALVVLAFYLGFVLLSNNSAQRSHAEATTVAIIATQIATLQPTPPPPTPVVTVTPSPVPQPASCAMLKQQQPAAEDGTHAIYLSGQTAVSLYCYDMANNPQEYLTLPSTANGGNFSLISYPEGAIITQYEKVRLDPNTRIIDPTDMTFAVLSGALAGYTTVPTDSLNNYAVTLSDFAVATGCNRGEEDALLGRANIDLTGTPFVIDPDITFTTFGGELAEVSSVVSEDGKTVNLAVNGRCGVIQPTHPILLELEQP